VKRTERQIVEATKKRRAGQPTPHATDGSQLNAVEGEGQ
jgi:hypothetical protein